MVEKTFEYTDRFGATYTVCEGHVLFVPCKTLRESKGLVINRETGKLYRWSGIGGAVDHPEPQPMTIMIVSEKERINKYDEFYASDMKEVYKSYQEDVKDGFPYYYKILAKRDELPRDLIKAIIKGDILTEHKVNVFCCEEEVRLGGVRLIKHSIHKNPTVTLIGFNDPKPLDDLLKELE